MHVHLRYARASLVKFLLCLLIFSAFSTVWMISIVESAGENWLGSWGYRKRHDIINATGATSNYQIGIKVYKSSGSDGTETVNGVSMGKVYVDSYCRDDFGDIRFTDDDGSTELDYWQDTDYLVSGISSLFWVEVADDLSSNQTIYIYYDNSDEETTSNGENTFLLFDDFSDESFNSTKWTEYIYGSGVVTEPAGTAAYLDVHPAASIDVAAFYSDTTYTNDVAFLVKHRQIAEIQVDYIVFNFGVGGVGGLQQPHLKSGYHFRQYERTDATHTNGIYEYTSGGSETADNTSGTINTDTSNYHVYEIRYSSSGFLQWLVDGVDKKSCTDTTYLTDAKKFMVSQGSYSTGVYGQDAYVDYVVGRQWVKPEPQHSSWYSAEPRVYLTYSDVEQSSTEADFPAVFSSFWIAVGDCSLSGYIFSWNASGSWANNTWVAFSDTNNTWANTTETLSYAIGLEISWVVYANSSMGLWYETTPINFTVQATITFYFNSGGSLWRNGSQLENGTATAYTESTTLTLMAVADFNYTYLVMNWSYGETTENPYNFAVSNQTDVFCYFSLAGGGGAIGAFFGEHGFAVAFILAIVLVCSVLIIFVFYRKRSDDSG